MQNSQKASKAQNSHLFKVSIQSRYLDQMSLFKVFANEYNMAPAHIFFTTIRKLKPWKCPKHVD